MHRGSRTQGRGKNYLLLRMDFPTMEKSDIIDIKKVGNIVSMTPYTQTQNRRRIQEWLEWILTTLFILIFTTFLCYHIHLTWRSDTDIILADYGRKEIKIYRYLRCLVAPVFLDIFTWPYRRKCWLKLSRPLAVTLAGYVGRNYISSLIWRCYSPKRDVLDYWGTILYCLLSY